MFHRCFQTVAYPANQFLITSMLITDVAELAKTHPYDRLHVVKVSC
jgi:hypothetical protein